MDTENKNFLYGMTIIFMVIVLIGAYVMTTPYVTDNAIKVTDYPVTPHEDMSVVQYDELSEEFQNDFVTAYTEDKYERSELKNIDIIQYNNNYYKVSYENVVTGIGFFAGSITFFSFMLLLVSYTSLMAYKKDT